MIWRRLSLIHSTPSWQRTLYIMFAAQFFVAIGFSNLYAFLPLYIQSLGTNTSLSVEWLAGLAFSAEAITMMLVSPIWGALADRYGRKLMVQRAMFGGALMLTMMGFVRSAEELLLLRAIQGLLTGAVPASNALVAAAVPRERTGYAMAVLQVGMLSGTAMGPLIGGTVADMLGYRLAVIITSSLLAVAGLIVSVGVKEVFEPSTGNRKDLTGFLADWRRIFQAHGVTLIYLLRFLSSLARLMLAPIAPLFIHTLLFNTTRANTITGLVIGLASITTTTTAMYLGRLGDRLGHQRVLQMSALAAALFYLPQSLVTNVWQLLLLQALTGAAAGGIIPTISALLASYTQRGEEGSVYGLDNSIEAGARGVAPLVGASIAFWLGLRSTFVATGLILLLIVGLVIWRLPGTRR